MGKFKKWIADQGGPKVVASLIGSESPTVKAWLINKSTPTAERMVKLVKLGKGSFDFNDIVTETTSKIRRGVRK